MIILKSPDEIDRMRKAGRIVAQTIERLVEDVRPGMTTEDLDRQAEAIIRAEGALPSFKGYRGFPATICTSLNEEVVHGIPSAKRQLIPGDILKLDVGCIWDGYHADSAVSLFVGGMPPTPEAEKLVRVTEESLNAGIEALRAGSRLSDVGYAVQQVAEGAGFNCVREYAGHGVGRALHEDPQVPNYGDPGRGPLVRPADSGPARSLDRGHRGRQPFGPLRAHHRRHRGGVRGPHRPPIRLNPPPRGRPFRDRVAMPMH